MSSLKIISYKSRNNNCLISCFHHAYEIKGDKTFKFDTVRKEMGITKGEAIDIKIIPSMSEYYNKKFNKNYGYHLIGGDKKMLMIDLKETNVNIIIEDGHYSLWEGINFVKCKECGRKLLEQNETHKCNIEMVSYKNHKLEGKKT